MASGVQPSMAPGLRGFSLRSTVRPSRRLLRATQQQFGEARVQGPHNESFGSGNREVTDVGSDETGSLVEGEMVYNEQVTFPGGSADSEEGGDPPGEGELAESLASQAPCNADMEETRGLIATIAKYFGLSPRVQGLVLLNLMTVLMATNWVVVKEAEETLDPFIFSALRFSVAAAAFFPFIEGAIKDRKVLGAGLEIGIWSSLGYILQAVGLVTTDASRASFLSTFTVILVPILVGATGRGVSTTTWGAAGLALVGTGLLENGGSPASIGDVYNLLSAACFAMQASPIQ